MVAKVIWHKGLSFTGTADTGFEVPLGASPQVGGNNDGFRPMELIAVGLAGCTAMDVISIIRKKREDITSFEVLVQTEQAERHPRVFSSAAIEYHVSGHSIKEDSVLRAIELSAEVYCPAQAMFVQVMPIEIKYYIYEDHGDDDRTLVKSGTYSPAG